MPGRRSAGASTLSAGMMRISRRVLATRFATCLEAGAWPIRTSCPICGEDINGKRAGARTCGAYACRKAEQRHRNWDSDVVISVPLMSHLELKSRSLVKKTVQPRIGFTGTGVAGESTETESLLPPGMMDRALRVQAERRAQKVAADYHLVLEEKEDLRRTDQRHRREIRTLSRKLGAAKLQLKSVEAELAEARRALADVTLSVPIESESSHRKGRVKGLEVHRGQRADQADVGRPARRTCGAPGTRTTRGWRSSRARPGPGLADGLLGWHRDGGEDRDEILVRVMARMESVS